jgi:nicotinamidase-related amidase
MMFAPEDAVLLVVDVQERLLPVMPTPERYLETLTMLLDVATKLGVPRLATEQYPKGLGPTVAALRPWLPDVIPSKTRFSAYPCLAESLQNLSRKTVVVVGMETPICVFQTAFDLLQAGYSVVVPRDAVLARRAEDHEAALVHLARGGAAILTVEMLAFAWLQDASHPEFKAISKLVVNRSS